jgi:multisubunit Na+/H+ antiporter MnhC subunit
MVILLLVILAFTLLLVRADNVLAVVVGVVVIGPGSFLFYKLIRVLSRIQMPRPPSR